MDAIVTRIARATRKGRGTHSKGAEQLLCGPWNAFYQLHEQGLGHDEAYAFISPPRDMIPPRKQPWSVLSASVMSTKQNRQVLAW